jgi:uncharacterized protein YjiS (DUF1127 family)
MSDGLHQQQFDVVACRYCSAAPQVDQNRPASVSNGDRCRRIAAPLQQETDHFRCNQISTHGDQRVIANSQIYFRQRLGSYMMDNGSYDTAFMSSLWKYWRNEREIRRTVRALAEFDDQTLRAMGIQDRSLVEFTVRYCREC